jgi:hypothetical protein
LFASIKASFKTLLVIFHSLANSFNSHLGTHNFFASISKSIGIFSARDLNSSHCNTQEPKACDNCKIVLPASRALAQVIVNHFDNVSSIVRVSFCVPQSSLLTKSNLTKALVKSSTGTLALFAVSTIFCCKISSSCHSATCLS